MLQTYSVIKNPFAKGVFRNLYNRYGKLTKNKSWELELLHDDSSLASFGVDLSWRWSHHAGPNIRVGLLGYEVFATIYDVRHWDHRTNSWVIDIGIW